jgi:pyridinium-3,5-bisthiocarboxylic acid mononucleotide nickel chelatase
MSWLLFDCPAGISGDMTLGALVDLGVPLETIRSALATLPLAGWSLRAERVTRNGIAATQVHVELETPSQDHVHRHLRDIVKILRAGKLQPRALAWAEAVFQRLADAEGAVHGMPSDHVHFHEVGAVDAIVDIAGVCTGLDWLCSQHGVQHMRVSQLRLGRGQTRTEHGMMPVPPPAVLRLLEGMPVQWGEAEGERVTPTGAAIVTALASPLGQAVVRVQRTGYGAGTRDFPDAPNVLRLVLCEGEAAVDVGPRVAPVASMAPIVPATPAPAPAGSSAASGVPLARVARGRVAVLRTTIDDMVPEFYGHLMEMLFAAGALDVQYTAVQGKKERPATHITVIAAPEGADHLAAVLLTESTTLGVRVSHEERYELERRAGTVQTRFGPIDVKIAVRPDGTTRSIPEYESVRRAAAAAGVPLADVYQEALRASRP